MAHTVRPDDGKNKAFQHDKSVLTVSERADIESVSGRPLSLMDQK